MNISEYASPRPQFSHSCCPSLMLPCVAFESLPSAARCGGRRVPYHVLGIKNNVGHRAEQLVGGEIKTLIHVT